MPISANFCSEKAPDERHGSSRHVCTLLQWQPRVTEVTSHHRARRRLEIWNPHSGITDSTVGLIQPQATAQVSFPSAKLEQYTFPSPKFELRGGDPYYIYIPKAFPAAAFMETFTFIYLIYSFWILFPKEMKFTWVFSMCFPVCACLSQPFFSKLANGWSALACELNLIPTFG